MIRTISFTGWRFSRFVEWTRDDCTHLLQWVQGLLWVCEVLLAEGFHVVLADDGFLQLLQPGPHQTGEDQRISLHAQPLPRPLPGVQLCLHITNKERRRWGLHDVSTVLSDTHLALKWLILNTNATRFKPRGKNTTSTLYTCCSFWQSAWQKIHYLFPETLSNKCGTFKVKIVQYVMI